MQVYLEPFGVPARERLQSLVADAKAANPLAPVTVVPPNAYAGIGLRRVLAANGGLLNVRFMALARLAEQLGAPSMAAAHRRPLSAEAELAIIRAVAAESAGQGELAAVVNHPTTHRSLQSTFQELARLTEDELQSLEQADSLRRNVVQLYRRFQERTTGYYRREDVAWAAAEAVKSGRGEPALRDVGALVFFLLPRPSPGEAALLEALSSSAPCVMVSGPRVDEAEVAWWERLGDVVDGGAVAVPSLPESIVLAPDVREEVRQAVREMLQLAAEGVPFHRMAALYRRPDPYAFQIRMELGFAGAPIAGPDPSPLRDSVAGRLLTGLLAVIGDDFGRAALMQWLADAPVWNVAGNRSASGEMQRWEGLSREAGVVRSVEQWRDRLQRLNKNVEERRERAEAQGELSESQARGYAERTESTARLLAFVERLAQEAPPADESAWSAFAEWAKQQLHAYAQGTNDWPEAQREALDRVEKALEELGKLDAVEASTTLAGFRQALDHALSASVGRSGATGTGVFVAGLGNAVGMEFEAVWLLGMSEGDYPARTGEDPLLPESVRAELSTDALPLRREAQTQERRSYLAALAAGQRRQLSYSRVDPVRRRSQYPSPWLMEAVSALAGETVSSEGLNTYSAPWLTVIESMEDALSRAANGRAADGHEYDLLALANWRNASIRVARHPLAADDKPLGRAIAMERARWSPELTAWDGYVGTVAAGSARLGGSLTNEMSPTRLEAWATCPYRHFLGSVLRLSAWDTPEEVVSISALERGSLVHKILERFIDGALESGSPPPAQGWSARDRERLQVIAQEEFRKAEDAGITGRRVLWEVVQEDILQDLDTFLRLDAGRRAGGGVRPLYSEYAFGGDGPTVSLALPDGGEVRFRGLIDRVDATPDGSRAVVMDYKTGGSRRYMDMQKDPLMAGTKLQLPVYALAMRQTALPDAELTAEYWFVSANGGFESVSVDLDAVQDAFARTVQTIADGVRNGIFPANPGPSGRVEPQNCAFCDFKRICPADKQAVWGRKSGSPQAERYVALASGASDDADGTDEDDA